MALETFTPMLTVINALQLIFYIAALSLVGQGLLYMLAGAKRQTNLFYQLLQILTRPFMALARWIAPRQIADSQIGFVAFCLIAIGYIAVTLWKIDYCVSVGMAGCRG